MSKHGQPDSATEMTDGRRSLLLMLNRGVADREAMAMSANWLRDLYRRWNLPEAFLERDGLYQRLMLGTVTDSVGQTIVARWLENLRVGTLSSAERKMLPQQNANDRQVAGTHYKKPVQHWDFVTAAGFSYLGGQVTKYVSRWKDKNGKVDLQKAEHFLQKMIELHPQEMEVITPQEYATAQGLSFEESVVVSCLFSYEQGGDPLMLALAQQALARMLQD